MRIEKRPTFWGVVFIPENAEERKICNNSDEFRVTNAEIVYAHQIYDAIRFQRSGFDEIASRFLEGIRKDQTPFYEALLNICGYLYGKGHTEMLKWASLPYPPEGKND